MKVQVANRFWYPGSLYSKQWVFGVGFYISAPVYTLSTPPGEYGRKAET